MSAAQPGAGDVLTLARFARRCTELAGLTYLERGHPVLVLARWSALGPVPCPAWLVWSRAPRLAAPRNVLIERGDGSRVVRPFRGLRRAGDPR